MIFGLRGNLLTVISTCRVVISRDYCNCYMRLVHTALHRALKSAKKCNLETWFTSKAKINIFGN